MPSPDGTDFSAPVPSRSRFDPSRRRHRLFRFPRSSQPVEWDFDPAKKYPVIEHIYNSAHIAYVQRTFSGGAYRGTYAQALAQLGFIIFMVDGRGTPGRGKAFQDATYGQLGRHEIALKPRE